MMSHSNTQSSNASRFFAFSTALVALGASLRVASVGVDCDQCNKASALLANIPLAWIGAAFYTVLAMLAGSTGFSRATKAGFFAASGVHGVLVAFLVKEKLFCGGCVTVASAAFFGAALSLLVRPCSFRLAVVAFVAASLATIATVAVARIMNNRQIEQLKEQLKNETPTTQAQRVKVIVYKRDGCGHCLDFEENVLAPLESAFGNSIEIERRDALAYMTTPAIYVIGKNGEQFYQGPMSYEDMEKAIRDAQ